MIEWVAEVRHNQRNGTASFTWFDRACPERRLIPICGEYDGLRTRHEFFYAATVHMPESYTNRDRDFCVAEATRFIENRAGIQDGMPFRVKCPGRINWSQNPGPATVEVASFRVTRLLEAQIDELMPACFTIEHHLITPEVEQWLREVNYLVQREWLEVNRPDVANRTATELQERREEIRRRNRERIRRRPNTVNITNEILEALAPPTLQPWQNEVLQIAARERSVTQETWWQRQWESIRSSFEQGRLWFGGGRQSGRSEELEARLGEYGRHLVPRQDISPEQSRRFQDAVAHRMAADMAQHAQYAMLYGMAVQHGLNPEEILQPLPDRTRILLEEEAGKLYPKPKPKHRHDAHVALYYKVKCLPFQPAELEFNASPSNRTGRPFSVWLRVHEGLEEEADFKYTDQHRWNSPLALARRLAALKGQPGQDLKGLIMGGGKDPINLLLVAA